MKAFLVADPHSFHPDPDPDPAFQAEYRSGSNTDPDPIRIQGFKDQKLNKITAEKKIKFFQDQKLKFTYPQASIKKVQVTEEAFSSQKRPSNTSKHELFKKKSTFVGHFCPPGSGSGSTDPIESGSNPDPDPQPCEFFVCLLICVYIYHFNFSRLRFGGQRIRIYLSVLALLLYVFTKISVRWTRKTLLKYDKNCKEATTSLIMFFLINDENHLKRFLEANVQLGMRFFICRDI